MLVRLDLFILVQQTTVQHACGPSSGLAQYKICLKKVKHPYKKCRLSKFHFISAKVMKCLPERSYIIRDETGVIMMTS